MNTATTAASAPVVHTVHIDPALARRDWKRHWALLAEECLSITEYTEMVKEHLAAVRILRTRAQGIGSLTDKLLEDVLYLEGIKSELSRRKWGHRLQSDLFEVSELLDELEEEKHETFQALSLEDEEQVVFALGERIGDLNLVEHYSMAQ